LTEYFAKIAPAFTFEPAAPALLTEELLMFQKLWNPSKGNSFSFLLIRQYLLE
jgi:hypothetical protein